MLVPHDIVLDLNNVMSLWSLAKTIDFWGLCIAWHRLAMCVKLGGALIVESMNPHGCIKGVLFVPRGYKIYIRDE